MSFIMMNVVRVAILLSLVWVTKTKGSTIDNHLDLKNSTAPTPCMCGVFLSGQFTKGSKEEPTGVPCLSQETEGHFMNNPIGHRQCMNKCLEVIIPHLTKSADIICATVGRDVHKERAFLFIKNYGAAWQNTNMSAGREFCCKDDLPVKCPFI